MCSATQIVLYDMRFIIIEVLRKRNRFPNQWLTCLLIVISLTGLIGCEQVIENPDLPYEEKIVIGAFVLEGSRHITIDVTRTLPLTQKYSHQAAVLADADVQIKSTKGIFKAAYNANEEMYRVEVPTIQAGETYELTVLWKDKRATSITRIPEVPTVISSSSVPDYKKNETYVKYYTFTTDFSSNPAICVGLLSERVTSYQPGDADMNLYTDNLLSKLFYAKTVVGNNAESIRYKRTSDFYYFGGEFNYYYHSALFATFDYPYHAMNISGGRYNDGDIFGSSGSNPRFNIKGDGVGYFIGTHVFPSLVSVKIKY